MAQAALTDTTRRRRSPARSLSDDTAMIYPRNPSFQDPDFELFTYPECIDQTMIGQAGRGFWAHDDMEIDDGL